MMSSQSSNSSRSRQLPSNIVAEEFGEVNIKKNADEIDVLFTILMEPQGEEAEGWQTGIALDASASMRGLYGRSLLGEIPEKIHAQYDKKGWITLQEQDGKTFKIIQPKAYEDAIKKGYLKRSENIVQPLAQEFVTYLATRLDADGETTVIYWAGGAGDNIEVLGDFDEAQCQKLEVGGPTQMKFGLGTVLTPAIKYFVERFVDAKRGMYIFITDGKLDDLEEVKKYTDQLCQNIKSGKRNLVKCVLIGVGEEIDQTQLEELDDLATDTGVDIWDHKIASEMSGLVEIFAEVVDENKIVAPTGTLYDSSGKIVKRYTDGLPAKVTFSLPGDSEWFELEVYGQRIRQTLTWV
ncbi:MAG: VWA domain-containing protein [Limnoraphis sp. WC205]|nr:VWA domain-containing protein [Limnoraphis sp. WC205]